MFFLVDTNYKIIFGWSAKCGCSHVKRIFWFFQNNNIYNDVHTNDDNMPLPTDIENYTTIIICRNPYKRFVSGFLDKYREGGQLRHYWKTEKLIFSDFVDEFYKKTDLEIIEEHHFVPQTSDMFDKTEIVKSKMVHIYDIENIDYENIECLYNTKLPNELLFHKEGHERIQYDNTFEEPVYDLDIDVYYKHNISITQFYNTEIQNKIYAFYENDFIYFKENGFDYKM